MRIRTFLFWVIALGMGLLTVQSAASLDEVIDDFDRANSDTIGGGWTEVQIDGDISGNALICPPAGPEFNCKANRLYNTKQAWDITYEIKKGATTSANMYFCVNGDNDANINSGGSNCVLLSNSNGPLRISINALVKNSSSPPITITADTWYRLRFQYNTTSEQEMRARIWPRSEPEPPEGWNVTYDVDGATLQKNSYMEIIGEAGDQTAYFDNVTNTTTNAPPASGMINISDFQPTNLQRFITNLLVLNATINSTSIFNVTLYRGGTAIQTKTDMAAGSNIGVSFNHTINKTEGSLSFTYMIEALTGSEG